jgi:hypothetical protein
MYLKEIISDTFEIVTGPFQGSIAPEGPTGRSCPGTGPLAGSMTTPTDTNEPESTQVAESATKKSVGSALIAYSAVATGIFVFVTYRDSKQLMFNYRRWGPYSREQELWHVIRKLSWLSNISLSAAWPFVGLIGFIPGIAQLMNPLTSNK